MRIVLRLRKVRQSKGLTQVELAAASGLTQGAVSRIEVRGAKSANRVEIESLVRLAVALGVTVDDLIEVKE